MDKPNFVEEKHLVYLDKLRVSGQTNMFGASSYVESAFSELSKKQARDVLVYWMDSFNDRHPKS